MKLKIALAGATGWAGSQMARAIHQAEDMQLVAAIAPSQKGKNLGEILNIPNLNLPIAESVETALTQASANILIDYTRADVAKKNVVTALYKNIHVVVGTSGLSDSDYEEIDVLARKNKVGVIAAGNYAITAVLLQKFALMAAKYLPSFEIIDYADALKPVAPSGTVNELTLRLGKVADAKIDYPVDETHGVKETRGANLHGMQVHSVRLPGYVLGVDVIFGLPSEKLILKHEAGSSAEPYVNGTLLATRKVMSIVGLIRGLDNILEF